MIVGMGQAFFVVDAFTDRPFAGNPAAVCVLDRAADESWMRNVAREMNLSETAFLYPESDAEGEAWRLRWLTPTVEVDLCGHATLATAHVLWESERASRERPLRFLTRSGVLRASPQKGLIALDFPVKPVAASDAPGLAPALGVSQPGPIRFIGCNKMDYLVELASATDVRACQPDMTALARLPVRGVMVTAPGDAEGIDFISRFFGPGCGIPEDPVTGSAHCALAPYWAAKLGKTAMVGFQASARGGTVRVEVRGERVQLAGHAVTVSKGELLFGPASC